YHYDRDGLLTQAGSLTLTPDPGTGLLNGASLGGVTTTNHYDLFGEFSGFDASFNGAPLYSTQYTPDAAGRLHQVIETIGSTTTTFVFDYDRNGQLRQVMENGTVVATYGYDSNGNRTSVVATAGTVTGTYNGQDELTQFGNATYAYAS